jgi:pimeloyl-ACP methyl ester carboxylesterase
MSTRSCLFVAASLSLCSPSNSMPISEQYAHFRESHAVAHLTVSGNEWTFIDTGTGKQTVVVLPGGGAIEADCMFPVVSALERQYRVIAIGYAPTAITVKEVVEGIRAVLDDRGVEHCCMLGHSLGGFVERAFAQAYPQRVDSLIIANSAVYTPGRMLLIRILLPVAIVLPQSVLASAIRSKFERLLQTVPESDREFWMSYVNKSEVMNPKSRGLRSQLRVMLDFRDKLATATGWNGRVLIIESAEETGFTLKERQILRSYYPGATIHIIAGAGHLSFITHTEEFDGTVGNFLAGRKS